MESDLKNKEFDQIITFPFRIVLCFESSNANPMRTNVFCGQRKYLLIDRVSNHGKALWSLRISYDFGGM
jgi:hypothetical protein